MNHPLLALVLSRRVVIATAVLAAVLVASAGVLRARAAGGESRAAALLVRAGYALLALSIGLFVAAGFLRR